jgi:hypothetical protein
MRELKRLVLTFKPEELIVHALYRSKGDANPGTVRRRREVEEMLWEFPATRYAKIFCP